MFFMIFFNEFFFQGGHKKKSPSIAFLQQKLMKNSTSIKNISIILQKK